MTISRPGRSGRLGAAVAVAVAAAAAGALLLLVALPGTAQAHASSGTAGMAGMAGMAGTAGGVPGNVQVPDSELTDHGRAPVTAADRDFVMRVRLAGLWEMPAGQMAAQKGVNPRVRQIGRIIASQHVQLDLLDRQAAATLGMALPNRPTPEQQGWLDEMARASGADFDNVFVMRLRAAHGKIFSGIAAIRAGTRNDVVRRLAQEANQFVLTHITLLESTGLVAWSQLSLPPDPQPLHLSPLAEVQPRAVWGGADPMLIWAVLGLGLVAGAAALIRIVRPG